MPLQTLARLIHQVRRRLFVGSLLSLLAWFWAAALALSVAWFFAGPYVINGAPEWLRWSVLGGSLAVATAAAISLAVLRTPNSVNAALSLDERFGLRERVTTSLTLGPDDSASPAGQALLADVEKRLAQVRVADRFPLALPWKPAALVPALAATIALLALLWNPQFDSGLAEVGAETVVPPDAREAVEKQMQKLASAKKEEKKGDDAAQDPKLKEIEAEIEKFVRKPRDTREQIQERIKDATELEAELERQVKEQKKREDQRADAFRNAMKQAERLDRLARKKRNEPERLGRKDSDVARGDMKNELDRLSRQLEQQEEKKERLKRKRREAKDDKEKDQLDREMDQLAKNDEELKKQIEEMKDMAERLSRKDEETEKELQELAKEGLIEKDELEREMEDLQKNKLTEEEKKELQELMKDLKECEECQGKGDQAGAAKKMAAAAKKAGQMGQKGEGKQAERQKMLARMRQVRRTLNRAVARGGAGVGAGRRPEAKDDNIGSEEKDGRGEWSEGKVNVVGEGPKGGRKFEGPRKPAELTEEIRRAGQEAAAAIDRQRLPPSARKMARDYFEKIRSQSQGKDAKKP